MRKRVLIFSIVCLMFVTLNYTYSAFKNTIVGTISGNAKDWVFKVNVDSGTVYNDSYKVHLTGTSGSFNVRISTVGGAKNAEYSIELTSNDLVKYYTDSAYTNLIENNIYNGNINSNTSSNVTIYYKASSSINDDVYVKVKGNLMEVAMMKNGASAKTEFWSDTYKPYIRTINFENDLSNLPSSCSEENLCWDISYNENQNKKVYGYLIDSGYKYSKDNTKILYNLYIVSETKIYAPIDCCEMFSMRIYDDRTTVSNLLSMNFNDNFDTSKVTDMSFMFDGCSSIVNLDLSSFNTSNVTTMYCMFSVCESLKSLNLSGFDTSKVTNMSMMFMQADLVTLDLGNFNTSNVTNMWGMFHMCFSLKSLNVSSFDTSKATNMHGMFGYCESLENLEVGNFNTSSATNMGYMFYGCFSLTSLDLSNFNTSNVTDMGKMFADCSELTTTISIMNTNITDYSNMFSSAATSSNANITVNYIADASDLVDQMMMTKSSDSNIVKGNIIPEHSITINGNDDIVYKTSNKIEGTVIVLTSKSGNNLVTSFKMNGTVIDGNEFIMPGNDVIVTDIVTVGVNTVETEHYSYPNSQDNVALIEKTFEGAKSLTVIIDCQTDNINDDYFYIYDSSTATSGINNNKRYGGTTRIKETITINTNYIKITFKSNDFNTFNSNCYGLKAIIIPNY